MSCTNEIQQVIRLYEARYLFPKLWGALLFMVKTVPEGEGEVGHLLALLTSFLNNLSSAPFIRLCLYVCVRACKPIQLNINSRPACQEWRMQRCYNSIILASMTHCQMN